MGQQYRDGYDQNGNHVWFYDPNFPAAFRVTTQSSRNRSSSVSSDGSGSSVFSHVSASSGSTAASSVYPPSESSRSGTGSTVSRHTNASSSSASSQGTNAPRSKASSISKKRPGSARSSVYASSEVLSTGRRSMTSGRSGPISIRNSVSSEDNGQQYKLDYFHGHWYQLTPEGWALYNAPVSQHGGATASPRFLATPPTDRQVAEAGLPYPDDFYPRYLQRVHGQR